MGKREESELATGIALGWYYRKRFNRAHCLVRCYGGYKWACVDGRGNSAESFLETMHKPSIMGTLKWIKGVPNGVHVCKECQKKQNLSLMVERLLQ